MTKQLTQVCDTGAARHSADCSDVNRNRTDCRWAHPLIIRKHVAATSGEVTPAFNPSHAQLDRGRVASKFWFWKRRRPRQGTKARYAIQLACR